MPSALSILAVGALAAGAAAQDRDGLQLTAEQRAVFRLLDQLVDPAACVRPFVRVSLGSAVYGGRQRESVVRLGFLLAAPGATIEVRFVDNDRAVVVPTGSDPELERVAADPADFAGYVRDVAADARAGSEWLDGRAERPLGTLAHALLLAHACAHRGDDGLLRELWAALPEQVRSLRGIGRCGVADSLAHGLAIACGDPGLAWEEIRRRHEVWLAAFPSAHTAGVVRARRDGIKSILDRRAARAPGVPRSAADLVLDLVDAADPPPGPPALFHFSPEDWPLPLPATGPQARREVLALGLGAVPALIDALDDPAPTRRVTRYRRVMFAPASLGETAAEVLWELAGRPQQRPSGKAGWTKWYEAELARRR